LHRDDQEAAQRFNAYLTSQQHQADERARAARPGAREAAESGPTDELTGAFPGAHSISEPEKACN